MAEKEIHIVFKVFTFIYGEASRQYRLLDIDKHILNVLAKHHGPKGIYPAIQTIAHSIDKSIRYTKTRLNRLEGLGLISIKRKPGKSSHYTLKFIDQISSNLASTGGDLQITGDLQGVIYSAQGGDLQSHYLASTDATINTNNQYKGSIQREKPKHAASRLPLSDFFKPDEQRQKLMTETCTKCSITEQSLMAKFRALQKTKDKVSSDWNAELELFLINERPSRNITPNNGQTGLSPTTAAYRDYFDEEKMKEREYWAKKLEERKNARNLLEGKK